MIVVEMLRMDRLAERRLDPSRRGDRSDAGQHAANMVYAELTSAFPRAAGRHRPVSQPARRRLDCAAGRKAMALRKLTMSGLKPFAYSFGDGIGGEMADVGRTIGSKTIGLVIQTVSPGRFSSRKHKHVFQEEILIVIAGEGVLHHGDERVPVATGDCVCYLPEDPEAHCFENTGSGDLVIWAFGNRFPHEVALYPEQGIAFVEGLGAEVPLSSGVASAWTEDRRKR
jgi:uncharacterized cupin superfamily protein